MESCLWRDCGLVMSLWQRRGKVLTSWTKEGGSLCSNSGKEGSLRHIVYKFEALTDERVHITGTMEGNERLDDRVRS